MVYTASADSEYKVFLPPRDFVGYGLEKPKGDVWPKGAKIAVSFVLNCELCTPCSRVSGTVVERPECS